MDYFISAFTSAFKLLFMRNTESGFVGRVGGVISPIFMGMMVIGMSLTSYLKDALSLFTVFAVSGSMFLISTLLLVPLFQKNRKVEISQN